MNDRSINVPPWLKRLPSWCRNVDKEQLDYFTNGSEQFSDNDIIDDLNVLNKINRKHLHHHGNHGHIINSTNLVHLYSSLHDLPENTVTLATVKVPLPTNVHPYSSWRCSQEAQTKASQHLSKKLTSNTPLKEQYAEILRSSNKAARESTSKALGISAKRPIKRPPTTKRGKSSISPRQRRNSTANQAASSAVAQSSAFSTTTTGTNGTTTTKYKTSLRPAERLRLKVASFRDNDLKKAALYDRVSTIESDNKSIHQHSKKIKRGGSPIQCLTTTIQERQQKARDRFIKHWTNVMHHRVEYRDKHSLKHGSIEWFIKEIKNG